MLGPDDLVLCAGTMARASFVEHVEAAARAGFRGVSIYPTDYEAAKRSGLRDGDMRAILENNGIALAELDPLMRWVPEAELGSGANDLGMKLFQTSEAELYAMGEALGGARSVNAVLFTDVPLGNDAVAEAFAALCDRAAEHGLVVHLEFLPWTRIGDIATALEIVELAGRPNGGVMFDTWHHFRSGAGDDALARVPGHRILGVQVNDAPAKAEGHPIEETTRRRRLPGEGDIDLVGLLATLSKLGAPAPIGVEVFSDALSALPPDEIAKRAADTTRAVLSRARGGA